MIKYIHNKLSFLDVHTKEVIIKSASSIIVKSIGILSGLAVSLLLGRNLGVEDYGTLELCLKIVNIILIICLFGLPNIVLKEVAISHSKSDWIYISDTIFTSSVIVGILSIISIIALYFSIPFLSESVFNNKDLLIVMEIYVFAIVFQSFSRIFSSGVNGFNKVWQSNLVNETLSLVIILSGILLLNFLSIEINLKNVAFIYLFGRVIVTITVGLYWKSLFPIFKLKRIFLIKLIKPSLSLLLVSASGVIIANASALILGIFSNSVEVGLYSVAAKISLLTIFFLQVTNSAIAPRIANLYSNKKKDALLKMLKSVTKILFLLGLVSFVFFLYQEKWTLDSWGQDFKNA